MDNLADKPECAALVNELDGRLQAELKRAGDDFRPPRQYIEAWGYDVQDGRSVPYTPGAKMQSPRLK